MEGPEARRHIIAAPSVRRLVCMTALGTAVIVGTVFVAPWQLALLTGWITAALTFLIIVWVAIAAADGEQTRRFATVEDDSVAVASLVVVGACTASLVGAAFALHKASQVNGLEAVLLTVASVVVVLVSWLVVNTEFTLRYAHRYFSPPVGGIDFPGTDVPDYRDFAYLAFTVGMTYQVSDTALLTPRFRRLLVAHAAASYLFGVVIVAAVINIVAGIVA
jgi:uncharacterized membrane protein